MKTAVVFQDPVRQEFFEELLGSGIDLHTVMAALMEGLAVVEVTPALRKKWKRINFGIAYMLHDNISEGIRKELARHAEVPD